MTVRKPATLVDGQWQLLQPGDSLSGPFEEQEQITLTNSESGSVVIGTPVYSFGAGLTKKAQADAVGTRDVIALVKDATIGAGTTGGYLSSGILTATTGQWDAVAGTTGGLIYNTKYYLSAAGAGLLTATPPTTGSIVEVGIAISTLALKINIKSPILL